MCHVSSTFCILLQTVFAATDRKAGMEHHFGRSTCKQSICQIQWLSGNGTLSALGELYASFTGPRLVAPPSIAPQTTTLPPCRTSQAGERQKGCCVMDSSIKMVLCCKQPSRPSRAFAGLWNQHEKVFQFLPT